MLSPSLSHLVFRILAVQRKPWFSITCVFWMKTNWYKFFFPRIIGQQSWNFKMYVINPYSHHLFFWKTKHWEFSMYTNSIASQLWFLHQKVEVFHDFMNSLMLYPSRFGRICVFVLFKVDIFAIVMPYVSDFELIKSTKENRCDPIFYYRTVFIGSSNLDEHWCAWVCVNISVSGN